MSVNNKYQAICDTIKERIASKVYTDRLPPRRELMEEFQVSSRTLHKVFQQLKISGIIEPTPTGTMICANAFDKSADKARIVLITPTAQENYVNDSITQTIAGNILKYDFLVDWQVAKKEDVLATLKKCDLTAKDSVIFTNSTFSVEAGNYLKENKISFVSVNRPAMGVDINWVDWNHLELFDDVTGYLVNRGARYLAFFGTGSSSASESDFRKLPDNHWQIVEDFEAAKKSYLLFYHKMPENAGELYCNVKKYVEYLLTLKHLPDVIWCGCRKARNVIAENLRQHGIAPDRILLIYMTHQPNEDVGSFGTYTLRSLEKLGNKAWELLMFSRLHPNAPCRGIKQHCEILFNKSLKKIRFDHNK